MIVWYHVFNILSLMPHVFDVNLRELWLSYFKSLISSALIYVIHPWCSSVVIPDYLIVDTWWTQIPLTLITGLCFSSLGLINVNAWYFPGKSWR